MLFVEGIIKCWLLKYRKQNTKERVYVIEGIVKSWPSGQHGGSYNFPAMSFSQTQEQGKSKSQRSKRGNSPLCIKFRWSRLIKPGKLELPQINSGFPLFAFLEFSTNQTKSFESQKKPFCSVKLTPAPSLKETIFPKIIGWIFPIKLSFAYLGIFIDFYCR